MLVTCSITNLSCAYDATGEEVSIVVNMLCCLQTPACEELLRHWGAKLQKLRLVGMIGTEMPAMRSLKAALSGLKGLTLGCMRSAPCGNMDLHDLPSGLQCLDLTEWELDLDPVQDSLHKDKLM